MTATHQYSAPGTYLARLTVTDSQGLSNQSAAQIVSVADGTAPTALFVFSPTEPEPGQAVFFNGSQSTPGSGHRIVSYRWSWGDGSATSSGSSVSHKFPPLVEKAYVVVLTVTDEVGQVGRVSGEVPVGVEPPEEEEDP